MNWEFTIIDRDGLETLIDEPVGWDACEIVLKRDLEKHGLIFDYQGNDFEFEGPAAKLLRDEKEAFGVDGNLTLKIGLNCGDNEIQELYRGRFIFRQYKSTCGDECSVKIPIETTGDIMTFTNRFDQKVNLETLKSFDEITDLPPYDKLGFETKLPSKGIYLQDHSKNDADNVDSFEGSLYPVANIGLNIAYQQIEFGLTEKSNEIGLYGFPDTPSVTAAAEGGDDPFTLNGIVFPHNVPNGPDTVPVQINPASGSALVLNYDREGRSFGEIENPVQLELHIKGKLELFNSYMGTAVFHLLKSPGVDGKPGNTDASSDFERIYEQVLYDATAPTFPGDYYAPGDTLFFDISFSANQVLNESDRYYCFISFVERKNQAGIDAVNAGAKAFKVTIEKDSFFKVSNLSHTAPSLAKLFMINETLSRIAEAVTDDKIRVYSDYFGRPDAQPYPSLVDGCGSLEAVTNGIFIRRQQNRIPDKPFFFNLSMKDAWEGINPIHNIGMGFEPDPTRGGFNRLRVEPWKWFYKNEIVLTCADINKIDRRVVETECYSTFSYGYEKWEAEEYNGIDEFLTKRIYRTTLAAIKNELSQVSKMIASGYTWEITRRKRSQDSKDWRYDNDTFIICLRRGNPPYSITLSGQFLVTSFIADSEPVGMQAGDIVTATGSALNNGTYTVDSILPLSGGQWGIYFIESVTPEAGVTATFDLVTNGLEVELGNIDTPENIIDPDTIYNFRISPIRNAIRWLSKVLSSYEHLTADSKLIFTDGTGNYHASGLQESDICRVEAAVISESETLDLTKAADIEDITPLLVHERVEFTYPMALADFKALQANPYGLIAFSNDCDSGVGWIDNMAYKPEEGQAKFVLIPKYS